MSSKPALSIRGLTKTYLIAQAQPSIRELVARGRAPWRPSTRFERFAALSDVSFDVGRGEILGVVGRNGAGKSTVLKILSRVTVPDAGTVDLYGRVGSLLEVGTGFHPELTGRENIYLNGAILGMRRTEITSSFGDIVDFAEIGPFLDTPVKRYSSGMYVRLAFAVAAHLSSEIMIVDEVLAVGDATFQAKCLAKIESIAESEGRTVLFVSHNLGSVRRLCQRVMVLERGRLAFEGAPEPGVQHYLTLIRSKDQESSEGRWALEDRENPHGDGRLWFRAVTTLDSDGRPSRELKLFEAMRIEIETESLERFKRAILGVQIVNELDQVVAGFTVEYHTLLDAAGQHAETAGPVDLRVPSLPLAPGRYSIHLGMSAARGGNMIDEVLRAAVFDVTSAEMDRREWLGEYGEASVFVPHSWGIKA